uniref:Uncharacterized protein n=1 Tax=Acrobeloides nanus TaxID=290746 RepID=A0A914E7J1_9BILA
MSRSTVIRYWRPFEVCVPTTLMPTRYDWQTRYKRGNRCVLHDNSKNTKGTSLVAMVVGFLVEQSADQITPSWFLNDDVERDHSLPASKKKFGIWV